MTFSPPELIIASPDDSISRHTSWSLGAIQLGSITISDLQAGRVIQVPEMPPGYLNMTGDDFVTLRFSDVGDYGRITLNVPASGFHVINVPAGYTATPRSQTIPVVVVGPSSVLQAMSVSDILGTITLAGISDISPGIRPVGATLNVAGEDVQAWVVGTYEAEILIARS
jgi:hypothetical protein